MSTVIEFNSTNDLGAELARLTDGRKTIIVREYGVEKFTSAIDPMKCRLEVLATFPRKIIDVRQAEYQLKRRKRNGNIIPKRRTKAST